MKTRQVRLAKVEIAYAEKPGASPPLLFLHGVTDSRQSYGPVLDLLDGRHRCLAMDFRGHGLSGRRPGAYRVRDYSDDVQEFLARIVGEPAVLAGHSLGGLVATFTAAAAPAWVRGVLLEDPPLYTGQMPAIAETADFQLFLALRELLRRHRDGSGSVEALAELVGGWPIHPRLFEGRSLLEIGGPDVVRARAESLHRMDVAALDPVLDGTQFEGFDPDDALARIVAPIRLVAGEVALGGTITESDVLRLESIAHHYTFEVMRNVGHFIHHTAAHEYVRIVQDFAASCAAPS